jgi:hypothetical protein
MAHYAFLDENNIVTEVIVGRNEWEVVDGISDWEKWYGDFRGQKCVRTSCNGNIRKQYAGIGYYYDEDADVFIKPQPDPTWLLDSNYDWQPPEGKPNANVVWNDETQAWEELNII